jgi:hypothetical protein
VTNQRLSLLAWVVFHGCITPLQAQAPTDDHGLGLRFATPEQLRGVPLAYTPFAGADLPPSVDLSSKLPTPGQQGRQNSCVAWTVAYALKSFQEFEEEKTPYLKADGTPNPDRHFSPAFIYNQINGGRDGGSLFIDALNVLSQTGAVPLSVMPYNEADFVTKPTPEQIGRAKVYRIDTWRQVNIADIKEVKAQLNANYPVVIGAMVDEGFLHQQPNQVWNSVSGQQKGGHAMLIVGYDDSRSAFKLLNSWGTGWGSAGYGWLGYGFFSQVVREGYVAKDAKNGPAPVDPSPVAPPVIEPSTDPRPAPPAPPPVQFQVADVLHNQMSPFGPACMVRGNMGIPPGTTGSLQIVVQFYLAGPGGTKGSPVGSRLPAFATFQGAAAAGTPPLMLSGAPIPNQPWFAAFPYGAFNLPAGYQQGLPHPLTHFLLAEPVLYINNFGVVKGPLIPMQVSL